VTQSSSVFFLKISSFYTQNTPAAKVDYSRQVTGYIRSLQTEDMVGHKRGHEEPWLSEVWGWECLFFERLSHVVCVCTYVNIIYDIH